MSLFAILAGILFGAALPTLYYRLIYIKRRKVNWLDQRLQLENQLNSKIPASDLDVLRADHDRHLKAANAAHATAQRQSKATLHEYQQQADATEQALELRISELESENKGSSAAACMSRLRVTWILMLKN